MVDRPSEVIRAVQEALAARREAGEEPFAADESASTESKRPMWLRKVKAWLAGTWGFGHRRKES